MAFSGSSVVLLCPLLFVAVVCVSSCVSPGASRLIVSFLGVYTFASPLSRRLACRLVCRLVRASRGVLFRGGASCGGGAFVRSLCRLVVMLLSLSSVLSVSPPSSSSGEAMRDLYVGGLFCSSCGAWRGLSCGGGRGYAILVRRFYACRFSCIP